MSAAEPSSSAVSRGSPCAPAATLGDTRALCAKPQARAAKRTWGGGKVPKKRRELYVTQFRMSLKLAYPLVAIRQTSSTSVFLNPDISHNLYFLESPSDEDTPVAESSGSAVAQEASIPPATLANAKVSGSRGLWTRQGGKPAKVQRMYPLPSFTVFKVSNPPRSGY